LKVLKFLGVFLYLQQQSRPALPNQGEANFDFSERQFFRRLFPVYLAPIETPPRSLTADKTSANFFWLRHQRSSFELTKILDCAHFATGKN